MDYEERARRRRKQKQLRKKQIRQHLILACGILAAGVIVLVLVISNTTGKKTETAQAQSEESTLLSQSSENATVGGADGPSEITAKQASEEAAEASSEAGITPEAVSENQAVSQGATAEEEAASQGGTSAADAAGLFDPEAGNVTPEELPAKVDETAAKLPECYTGELLPATTAVYTDRSSDFSLQPGVPCGADPVEGEKVVYLTLDDGPSANTITALNILDHYGIKATFFVTGLNSEYMYLVKEAYDRGHTIGLHTWSHDYSYIYSSVENYYADLNSIGQAVQEQIGFVPCFIRFPGGSSNYISHDFTDGIMTVLTQDVGQYGYQYFDWNASSGDGSEEPNAAQLADAAISYNYYDTIVLLSHDGSGKEKTMHALPFIIEYYLSRGYEFRPITRSAYTAHHSVEN